MAEQILQYDPSTNLELVQDEAGNVSSRKRFSQNASGVRYKGDPRASFQAAQGRPGSEGERGEFSRATLGSLAEGYDPRIGGLDTALGQGGFNKSGQFSGFAAHEATSAPLLQGRFASRTGANLDNLMGGDRNAGERYGEQLQSAPAQEYLGGVKQSRKDVLESVLGAGIPVGGQDLESALQDVRFTPNFQEDLSKRLMRGELDKARTEASGGFGSGWGGVLGALGQGAGFLTGGPLGLAASVISTGMKEKKEKALRGGLDKAIRDLGPSDAGSGVNFSDDVFSRDTGSVLRPGPGEVPPRRRGYRLQGGL